MQDSAAAKDSVKTLAKNLGMDLCGVSGLDRFATSPAGRHPTDILPGCKSVIVVGVRLLDGVVQANFRAFEDGRTDLKGLYGTYGYSMLPNFELTYACYAVAQHIERESGEVAVPCSTGPMTNGAQLSIRHAAVAAGLGEFGWLSIVLTPEFGARNRFGVILTTLELEPDPMYDGKKLCLGEKCGICAKVCPNGALGKIGESEPRVVDMGGHHYEYATVSIPRCHIVLMKMRKEFGGKEDYVSSNDPASEEIAAAMGDAQTIDEGLQRVGSHHCGRCLSYCPAARWGEKFKARGLTKGSEFANQ
ncbi:MAG: hypothetical protein LBS90_07185 [Oscillospiraceae bacterium]|jgi:epoxyqueuosine reductase QueG|nr:hypothetical protein [Oscillospiraceae bacterium]